ncbi:MAG TPA: glycosyltransferase [Pyrinomonadaceae bacterium]|nr:glycosyltransferase [Pyrinomonadaceae bacterium]
MEWLSELFDETTVVVPCKTLPNSSGTSGLKGKNLNVVRLSVPGGNGFRRKLGFATWLITNSPIIWRQVKAADAIHAPIPGDVGTVGIVFSMLQRKPLFVRHCGNWLVQRTIAEKFWKWLMEHFAGGRNVMMATGGTPEPPSSRNPNIEWIFSTSLRRGQMEDRTARTLPSNGHLKLLIACRQEERKGTDVVIASLPLILEQFPLATLDVIGDGSLLPSLGRQADALGVSDKITFHGKVEQARVVELMSEAHLFCYPTTASEGFPKVVIEALSCGLPVITTKVSVLPSLLGTGGGILLDKPAAATLAAAVFEICGDAGKYVEMSRTAIDVSKKFTLENWRDSIAQALKRSWNVTSLDSGQVSSL